MASKVSRRRKSARIARLGPRASPARPSLATARQVPLCHPATHHSPLTTHHLLLTSHHSPRTSHHAPCTTNCSALNTHHPPPTYFRHLLGHLQERNVHPVRAHHLPREERPDVLRRRTPHTGLEPRTTDPQDAQTGLNILTRARLRLASAALASTARAGPSRGRRSPATRAPTLGPRTRRAGRGRKTARPAPRRSGAPAAAASRRSARPAARATRPAWPTATRARQGSTSPSRLRRIARSASWGVTALSLRP